MSDYIVTYGQPGGLWFGVTLNLNRNRYEVHNEGGDVVFVHAYESMCRLYCEDRTEDFSISDGEIEAENAYLDDLQAHRDHILGSDPPDDDYSTPGSFGNDDPDERHDYEN